MYRNEHKSAPRDLERNADVVDGIRAACTESAPRFELLRPLHWSFSQRPRQRMLVDRRDGANKFSLVHPGGVEVFDVTDPIGKNYSSPHTIIAVIDKSLVGSWR